MAGHLFIVRGDITELSCDDWLLPAGGTAYVTHGWWRPWLHDALREAGAWCNQLAHERLSEVAFEEFLPLENWQYEKGPRPWLMNIRGRQLRMERVRQFLAMMAAQPLTERHLQQRGKRLVAIPVIGTGHGGSRHEAGKVIAQLVPLLHREAHRLDLDIALVMRTDGDFTAGQQARAAIGESAFDLPETIRSNAEAMAIQAASGQLVLFLGAGVSAGAGLPAWKALLERLAEDAGFQRDEQAAFQQLDALDQAEYLAQKLGGHSLMGHKVAAELRKYSHYSLSHGLLASTPFTEAVTTNYDQLFEQACHAASRQLAVLPYAPNTETGRWLLKMHGCLDHPEDIVLTRQSYLRYAERNSALSGIVQTMLITKHMLFLGFSLSDDNFLRIVDAVRRAVQPHEQDDRKKLLGTAAMLFESPLLQTLWQDELHWVCMGTQEQLSFTDATRRLEVFLDCLAFRASAQSHLLDPRFKGVLTPEDNALKQLLLPLLDASDAARAAAAWPHIAKLLRHLGGKVGEEKV